MDSEKMTDEKVVELIRKGNKEIFTVIIERYQEKLLRYAYGLLGDDGAQDAVQNAFIKVYVNLNGFNVNKKFSSWIYRIVHNEAMNLVIKERRKISLDENWELDSGVNMEDELIKKELAENARKCLQEIPLEYSEPLTLFYLESKSYEEIGDILRLPVGTVGTRINRAKKLLKRICQKNK